MHNCRSFAKARLIWRLGGVSVILATIAVGRAVTIPIVAAQDGLKQRIDAMELLKSTDATVLTNLAKATEEVRSWREKEARRVERTSPKNDETAFLEWANRQSQASSLEVRDFRPSNRVPHGDYLSRSVVMSAHGSYESVCQFLDKLRQCPYMIRVASLEILPLNQQRSSFGVTFNIFLFTTNPQPATSPAKQG